MKKVREKICKNCGYKFVVQGVLSDGRDYCGGCYPRTFEMFCDALKQAGTTAFNKSEAMLKKMYTHSLDKIAKEIIMPSRCGLNKEFGENL